MNYLDKIETESLFGMLRSDLESCINDKNEFWGKEEYESLVNVLNEIELRYKLVERKRLGL